jgi:photosystem I subunit 10
MQTSVQSIRATPLQQGKVREGIATISCGLRALRRPLIGAMFRVQRADIVPPSPQAVVSRPARMSVVPRAEFLGSTVNQVRREGRAGCAGADARAIARAPAAPGALRSPRRRASPPPRPAPPRPAPPQIMILSTTLPLVAGRFGLAPTANRHTTAGLKLYEDKSAGLLTNDPAGEHPAAGSACLPACLPGCSHLLCCVGGGRAGPALYGGGSIWVS